MNWIEQRAGIALLGIGLAVAGSAAARGAEPPETPSGFRIDAPRDGAMLVGPVSFRFTPLEPLERIDVFAAGRLVGSARPPDWAVDWAVPAGLEVREVRALGFRDGRLVARESIAATPVEIDDTVNVTNVQLHPVVFDSNGSYVTNLGAEAFEVLESGRPIGLEAFAAERVAVHLAVMVDASLSMTNSLPLVQEGTGEFLDRLQSEDIVSVYGFNHGVQNLLERSSDRAAAGDAIRSLSAGGGTALYDSVVRVLGDLEPRGEAEAWRRRAILLFSDGRDERSLVSLARAVERARESDVMIYALSAGHALDTLMARQDLRQLAVETGGEFFVAEKLTELPAIFDRVLHDLASQYRLVFTPPVGAHGTRQVEVRVRRPGLRVRCRTSYFAP